MARYHGVVGYGVSSETPPGSGVWQDSIVEVEYFGDVTRNTRRLEGDKVNTDISVGNTISIVADEYAINNFMDIKYVKWSGRLWTVTSVEVQSPRLLLSLGEVYNGQQA